MLVGLFAVGVMAALVTAWTDVLMLAQRASGRAYDGFAAMREAPPKRVATGLLLGVAAFPFTLAGVAAFYFVIAPVVGEAIAALACALIGYGVVVSTAVHGLLGAAGLAGEKAKLFGRALGYLRLTAFLALIAGSLGLVWAAISAPHLRVLALANPTVAGFVFSAIARRLPSPAGGYAFPSAGSLSFAAMFAAAAMIA